MRLAHVLSNKYIRSTCGFATGMGPSGPDCTRLQLHKLLRHAYRGHCRRTPRLVKGTCRLPHPLGTVTTMLLGIQVNYTKQLKEFKCLIFRRADSSRSFVELGATELCRGGYALLRVHACLKIFHQIHQSR